jgi:RNA polymerase-binding transcription factor DksA
MSRIETEARDLLLQRRRALRREQSAPQGSDHFDETAPGGVLASRVLAELAQIDEALGRIDRGSYGTCVACGGPLGLQRIRAIPEARYCLGCSGQRPSDD